MQRASDFKQSTDPKQEQICLAEAILGLVCSPRGHPEIYERLLEKCQHFHGWEMMPDRAEMHGLGPLLYQHIQDAGVMPPASSRRALQGLYLRHRHANAVREQVLGEIVSAYASARIQVLVLKGAALAHLVYPQPGLRPMRDIDLLVPEHQALAAQNILADLGFDISHDPSQPLTARFHHLQSARRKEQGLTVSVEVHYRLLPKMIYYPPLEYEDLCEESIPVRFKGFTANTLGLERMLWHVYRHACGPPLLSTPLRYIHVADMVGIVDRFYDRLDWELIQRRYPQLLHIMPPIHCLTPWSQYVQDYCPSIAGTHFKRAGCDYQGWPRKRLKSGVSLKELLKETLCPGEWWVRIFYGVHGKVSIFWYYLIRHPLHLFECVTYRTLKKLQGDLKRRRQR